MNKKKPHQPLKIRAVIYARVSTKEQRDVGYSIEAQIALLRGYCLAKGFEVIEEIIEADTAKESGRLGFARLCSLLRSNEADAVIVEKTDRLYRNLKDRVIIDDLKKELHFAKEGTILTPDSKSSDKFIADIKLVVAKNYIDNLSEEARKGMLEKCKAGIYPSHAPLGYTNTAKDGKRIIEPCPNLASKVALIFSLFATGDYSARSLSTAAQQIGLTSKKGRSVSTSVIHSMLRNPIYIGHFNWNGTLYQGIHSPIVDLAVWRRVQRVLEGRGKESQPVTKNFAYRGLIRCARCNGLMSPFLQKGRYVYYTCSGYKNCEKKYIREEAITDALAKHFEGLAIKPEYVISLRAKIREVYESRLDTTYKTFELLEAKKMSVDKKLVDLYLDFSYGRMSEGIYLSLRSEWEKESEALAVRIAGAKATKSKSWEDIAVFFESLSNLPNRFKNANPELKREMFKSSLSNCVSDGQNVVFSLRPWFKIVWEANTNLGENSGVFGMAEYLERLATGMFDLTQDEDFDYTQERLAQVGG